MPTLLLPPAHPAGPTRSICLPACSEPPCFPSQPFLPTVGRHLGHHLPDHRLQRARGLPAVLPGAQLAAPAVPGRPLPLPLHPPHRLGAESVPGAAAAAGCTLGGCGRTRGTLGAGDQGVGGFASWPQVLWHVLGLTCRSLSALQPLLSPPLLPCVCTVHAGGRAGGSGDHGHTLLRVSARAR